MTGCFHGCESVSKAAPNALESPGVHSSSRGRLLPPRYPGRETTSFLFKWSPAESKGLAAFSANKTSPEAHITDLSSHDTGKPWGNL